MENESATILLINLPTFLGWNSDQVNLNELTSCCKVTPTMVGNSARLDLNLNTLLTTRLAILIMKYFPKASARLM